MTNFEPASIRPYPIEQHPLNRQNYLVASDPISLAWQHLNKAICRRSGGLVFFGMFRAGKTSMIEYLKREAKFRYKDLPTGLMAGEQRSFVSEKEFYTELCSAVGVPTTGTAGECKRRAIQRMVEKGVRNIKHVYLLFIDEPQKWTDSQLTWLCEVYDKLETNNVRLISVLVGQRQLVTFRKQYMDRGSGLIITRLMNTAIEFFGLRSVHEVAYVLQGYDTLIDNDPEWPATRFFFPRAFGQGFRLEHCAEMVWQAFSAAIDGSGKFPNCQIPMKYLTAVVETFFLEYHESDAEDYQVERALLDQLLEEVYFLDYLDMADEILHGRARI